jgi:hypothetical protein
MGRRLFLPCFLCLSLSLPAVAAVAAELAELSAGEPRFILRASLAAEPGTVADGRFTLRAALQPSAPSRREAVGFSLKAGLVATADITCPPPGFLFGNGFESLPKP